MKTHRHFADKLVVLLATALVAALAGCGTAKEYPGKAVVLRLHGAARYSIDGAKWRELKKGQVLKVGAVVQTAPKSLVDLEFYGEDVANPPIYRYYAPAYPLSQRDANVVRVFENSALVIDGILAREARSVTNSAREVLEIEIKLHQGQIIGHAAGSSERSIHKIKFGENTAWIEGGLYSVDATNFVACQSGKVVVSIPGNEPIEVSPLHEYNLITGETTNLPVSYSEFPIWDPVPSYYPGTEALPQTAYPIIREPMTPPSKH